MQRNATTRILIFLLVLALATAAGAQVRVGALGGLNLSDFRVPEDNPFDADPDDFLRNTVYGAGAFVETPLVGAVSLRAQLLFLKTSCDYREQLDQVYTYNLSYLELPLLFKVSLGRMLRPYFLAGPSVGYAVAAEADLRQGVVTGTADVSHITKKLDFSLCFGAGLGFDIGRVTLFVEGLYVRGLRNVNKGGSIEMDLEGFLVDQEVDPLDVKPFGTHLMAGVSLPLGGRK